MSAMSECESFDDTSSISIGRDERRREGFPDGETELTKRRTGRKGCIVEVVSVKIAEGQTLLGSSDVIESLFGKFKELTQKSPVQELAASVLLLPLLAGRLSNAEIKEGLEAVSGKEVRDWLKEEMGETARARKRRLLGQAHATEQADASEGPKAA